MLSFCISHPPYCRPSSLLSRCRCYVVLKNTFPFGVYLPFAFVFIYRGQFTSIFFFLPIYRHILPLTRRVFSFVPYHKIHLSLPLHHPLHRHLHPYSVVLSDRPTFRLVAFSRFGVHSLSPPVPGTPLSTLLRFLSIRLGVPAELVKFVTKISSYHPMLEVSTTSFYLIICMALMRN